MGVKNTYNGYDEELKVIQRVKDFYNGEDTVKKAGTKYLPSLDSMGESKYKEYKQRSYVVPATRATELAVTGSIMRKDPIIDESRLSYMVDNIDGNGTSLSKFTTNLVKEMQLSGGSGILVEFHDNPVFKTYKREDIINVSSRFVVVKQYYEEFDDKDEFKVSTKVEYLAFMLDKSGNYVQRLFREDNGSMKMVDEVYPTKRGKMLNFIPFYFCKTGSSITNSKPTLLDLVNANVSQYVLSADLRHGLHWTALPTLFLFGEVEDENGDPVTITLGAGVSNHIQDSSARVELLEFTGSGLSAVDREITRIVRDMASIGAKMLADGSDGVKSAETSRIEASAETATLTKIVNEVEGVINEALVVASWWIDETDVKVKLNRDFIDVKLDSQSLTALLQVWQSGGMSLDTFLYQLESGEILPKGKSRDDEKRDINEGAINPNFIS